VKRQGGVTGTERKGYILDRCGGENSIPPKGADINVRESQPNVKRGANAQFETKPTRLTELKNGNRAFPWPILGNSRAEAAFVRSLANGRGNRERG